MAKDIYLSSGNISSSLLSSSKSYIDDLVASLSSLSAMSNASYRDAVGSHSLYSSGITAEAASLLRKANSLSDKLARYSSIMNTGPDELFDLDDTLRIEGASSGINHGGGGRSIDVDSIVWPFRPGYIPPVLHPVPIPVYDGNKRGFRIEDIIKTADIDPRIFLPIGPTIVNWDRLVDYVKKKDWNSSGIEHKGGGRSFDIKDLRQTHEGGSGILHGGGGRSFASATKNYEEMTASLSDTVMEYLEPGWRAFKSDFYNLTGIEIGNLSNNAEVEKTTLSGNVVSDAKDYYDNYVDANRTTATKQYTLTSHGSTTKGTIIDGINYNSTYDVRTIYGTHESGYFVENATAGYTQTSQHVNIYSGLESQPDIQFDFGKFDLHAIASKDLAKGNLYASGGAEFDVASITLGQEDFNVKGKIGFGAGGTIGIHDGIFEAKGSLALGLGGEVNIKVDYAEIWNGMKDSFEDLKFW